MSVITDILDFFSKTAKKVKGWLSSGNEIANEIKKYADSPLLDVVVGLTSTKLDDIALKVVRTALASFIKAVGWANLKLNDLDPDTKTVVLNAISAVASKTVAYTQDGNLNIQTALTGAQYSYDKSQIKV